MIGRAVTVSRPRRGRRVAALAATGALAAGVAVVAGPGVGSEAETEQGFALLKSAQGYVSGRVIFYGTDSTVTRVEAHIYLPRSGAGASPAEVAGFHGLQCTRTTTQPDNLGNVPVGTGPTQYTPNSPEATSLTARTGNAGDRLACGLVRQR